jgi:hypothetical protein
LEKRFMRLTIYLGFDFVPGSIRVRARNVELPVEELDPTVGSFRIEMPGDASDPISVEYQRTIYRGGAPRTTIELGTADACIYCGSRSDLRDEHVIPFALEGEYVLRKATCGACADKTSRIELTVLRGALLAARASLQMRTRHKSVRPKTLPVIELDEAGQRRTRQVRVTDHPTYIVLPTFEAPALLRGAAIPNLVCTGAWAHLVGSSTLPALGNQLALEEVGIRLELDIYAFARLLAKIAHGFVAGAGIDGAIGTELPSAMFAEGEVVGWWVGGAPDITLPEDGLHAVGTSVADGNIHVRIRLFAQLGGPEYLVIAGRRIGPTEAEPSVSVTSAGGATIGREGGR